MKLSNPLSSIILPVLLLHGVSSTHLPVRRNTTLPSLPALQPFLQFETSLSLQYLTTDISGQFGLFQQTRTEGTFNGKINGTLPPAGNLEITYPGHYPGVTNGFATATLILNTTCGVPISLRGQGPVRLGVNGEPVVSVIGSAFLQTTNDEFAYLNEKAFVFELCGGTSGGANMGKGTLYEVQSTEQCTLQTI
nr:hypothetical protein CFP56_16462 [Quercus suber]